MSQNGGEKELILGNKQLISLFFIVVALCGVFFAMGYMVRGNSIKGTVSTTGDNTPSASDGAIKRQQPEPPRENSEAAPPDAMAPAENTARTGTHPAEDTPSAPAQAGASVDPQAMLKPEGLKPEAARPEAKTGAAPMAKPEAADADAVYIQVSALGRSDADNMARTLREQNFPVSVSPSSKENLYRVRVGPYHQTSDVADAKARLKTLGFSNTIVQKQ